MTASPDRLAFSPNEVAEMTGLNPRTVRDLCERHEIDATKAGAQWLIPRREVERLTGDDLSSPGSVAEEREVVRLKRELEDLRAEVNRRVGRLLGEE